MASLAVLELPVASAVVEAYSSVAAAAVYHHRMDSLQNGVVATQYLPEDGQGEIWQMGVEEVGSENPVAAARACKPLASSGLPAEPNVAAFDDGLELSCHHENCLLSVRKDHTQRAALHPASTPCV